MAVIGDSYPDKVSKKQDFYCDIVKFEPFEEAVSFKLNDKYIEIIPENKKSNNWRDGVREITEGTYNKILSLANVQFDGRITLTKYHISASRFSKIYNLYLKFIVEESGGEEFSGFNQGFMSQLEGYKTILREEALRILDIPNWNAGIIGSGEITRKVIDVLVLEDNNLVDTTNRFGPERAIHIKLLDAVKTGSNLREIEQTIFNLYKSDNDNSLIFDRLTSLVGKKYPLIAFLFYLKNDREFLPISPINFEYAFKELGCDLKLSKKCSWENYSQYLTSIRQVKVYLEDTLEENINFIDAHSFLWKIGHSNLFRKWVNSQESGTQNLLFNAFEVSPVNNLINKKRTLPIDSGNENEVDWEKQNRRKRIKGRRAEELVLEYERNRLIELGKPEFAKAIEDYSKRYSKGFDIRSFNEDGTERHIEVKTSNSNGFIITRNELAKSEINPYYWIYLVSELENEIRIKMIQSPSFRNNDKFRLEPKDYYVTFSIES